MAKGQANNFLKADQLNFFDLNERFKEYLRGKPEYSDFDFEGSNFAVLTELLSYNTYLNAFYLNQVGSEMFMDTAKLKESVVSQAKDLNYTPRSRSSARAIVDITVNPNDSPDSITIPRNYKFTTTIDGVRLTYLVPETVTITPAAGLYRASGVEIYEGEVVTEFFEVSGDRYIFPLQSENIDLSSLRVTVRDSSVDDNEVLWQRAESLFGLSNDSEVYFVEGFRANQYQLTFPTQGTLGKKLTEGNIVKVEYRDTVGTDGNGAATFSPATAISNYPVAVSTIQSAKNGNEREGINSIRINSQKFYQTQERAVIEQDYETIVKRNFPEVQSVIAYGGEKANPPQYGSVIISVKPAGAKTVSTTSLKNRITRELTSKSLKTPVVIDPDYFNIEVKSNVFYSRNLLTSTVEDIRTRVINTILGLNDTDLLEFGSRFRPSRVTTLIDDTDDAIQSNEIRVRMVKIWRPQVNVTQKLSFSFNNAIRFLNVPSTQEQPLGHPSMLGSNIFTYQDRLGVNRQVQMQDNGRGTIFLYRITDSDEFIIVEENVGTINYETGKVDLTLNLVDYDDAIRIFGRTVTTDIIADKNQVLFIEGRDISVNMVET